MKRKREFLEVDDFHCDNHIMNFVKRKNPNLSAEDDDCDDDNFSGSSGCGSSSSNIYSNGTCSGWSVNIDGVSITDKNIDSLIISGKLQKKIIRTVENINGTNISITKDSSGKILIDVV